MQITPDVHTGRGRRRTLFPKLPLSPRQYRWLSLLIFLAVPLVSFGIVEILNYNNPFTSFTPLQVALNLVWYYLGEAFFYFLRGGRPVAAAKWSLGFAWGWGMANHYIISFRGRTLFPGDFLTLRTAANVAGNYDYTPDETQILCTVIMLACMAVLLLMPREEKRPWPWKRFVVVAAGTAVYLVVFFGTNFLSAVGIEPSMWTTRGNGWLLNFSVCLRYMRTEPPEGYSLEEVQAIADGTEQTSASGAVQPENLIVIMGESFADLSVLPGVETNQDPMPFFRSLTENTIKGDAYSSVFGGTTANSEYEFLTGNTTAFFPAGTVAYQMYVSDDDPSLVDQVEQLGYRTVAMHPYYSSGWNRIPVYTDLGFDEMMFLNDFEDKEYMRGYVTDQSDYENLIRVYEEKEEGEPLFIFNVTMQNHSAYSVPWTGLEKTTWLTGDLEGQFNTVDQYLSLMYQSDRALEYLINYFSQVEEPTMILVFGDHQPQVATNFYTQVLGSDPDLAAAQKKQMVPFLIWANYDIPEADGVETSLNYLSALLAQTAGLPLTGYQSLLTEVSESLPVINSVGYRDADGVWHESSSTLDEETAQALLKYQILQYNNVFDKADRVEDFFTLPGTAESSD